MIEKALSRLKIIAINNYSFEQLKVINFEDQQYVFNSEFELIIDEFSIKRWLMQKWGFDFLKPQCFFSLTSALYKAVTSSGDKSEWMQAVNEMLERTRLIDTLLYLTKKRHRDHSRHQFYVAGIGLFFLNSKIRRNESIVGYLTRVLNNKYKSDKIWTEHSIAHSWIVSSLLHDSAYALSHVLEMVANAFQEESAITSIDFELITAILKQSNIFSEKWAGWVSHIKNDFDLGTRLEYSEVTESLRQELVQSFQPYFNYLETKGIQRQSIAYILNEAKLKPSLIFDHGIWSAANLINLLSELKPGWTFIKTLSDKEAAIMAEVVEAIALHNIALHDYGVTFKHNPIACFLRFCDQIQEWNRGTWAEGKFMEEMNHIGVSPVLEIAGQTYIDNGIEICFEYQQTDKLFEAEWDLEKFIKPKKQLQIIDFPIRISYRISMPFVSPSLS
jgi:hypothetical protein